MEAVGETRRLSFAAIERVRATICDGASREATLRGAIGQAPFPQLFVEDLSNTAETYSRKENLSWWRHSRGQLNNMAIWVEAKKTGDKIFALISKI